MSGVLPPEMMALMKNILAYKLDDLAKNAGTGFALPKLVAKPKKQRQRAQTRHAASMKKHRTMKEKVAAS